MGSQRATWGRYPATVALVALATATGVALRRHLAAPDLVMLYLLVIVVVATRFGRVPSLLACALSVLAFDWFFVPPFHTFVVADERHLLTFATLFVVGLLISALMTRVRRHEREAIEREKRTAALYSLSRALGSATDEAQAAAIATRHTMETFGGSAEVLLAGIPPAGSFPLRTGTGSYGALVLSPAPPAGDTEQLQLAEAFASQAATAIERARLAQAARAAELRARTEEMRSSLLSAVSHDLRTPLAAITGAATTLREGNGGIGAAQRADLADTICEEAERLERFVVNLLEMTRLEAGALEVKREWVPLEELVGSALTRLEARLGGRPVHVPLPADLPLISVDPVLLEQVFYNLLENAAKHTPPSSPVEISARVTGGGLVVEVSDRGPGLPTGAEARVFEKFYRAAPGGVRGAGLGLAICRGIVQAHGGTITAETRPEGGAAFRVTLPLTGEAPSVPAEPPESPRRAAGDRA